MAFYPLGQPYQLLCADLKNTKMHVLFLLLHFKDRSLLSLLANLAHKAGEESGTYLRTSNSFVLL